MATTSVPAPEAAFVATLIERVARSTMPVAPGMTVIVDPGTVRAVRPVSPSARPRYRAVTRIVHGATGAAIRYRATADAATGTVRFARINAAGGAR